MPRWTVERAARHLERPEAVLVVRPHHGQRVVAGACAASGRAGVRTGLTLAHARALLAGRAVHVAEEDPHADAACLLALARWASRRWSPVVSADPPDGLLIDTTGCDHLFGGEEELLCLVERSVRALGITARGGLASTVGAAWAVARYGGDDPRVVPAGDERAALADLPAAALRLDADTLEALAEVGVERIGQVMDLPRRALPARYGPDLLRRLDLSLGVLPEIVDRTGEALCISASRELPGATTSLESLIAVIQILLSEVTDSLAQNESGLRRLDVIFDRMGSTPELLVVHVTRATRDADHLWNLLRPRVERVNMGFGVERVSLEALGIARLAHQQRSLRPEQDAGRAYDREFAAFLDTVASRLGRASVLAAALVPRHRPERAFCMVAVDESTGHGAGDRTRTHGPRPSRLFDPPLPAQTVALSPDGPVMRVRWRGGDRRVLLTVGPERLGPEWWLGRQPTRDYFRVQDDTGRWLWMFREATTARWFVHGEWS